MECQNISLGTYRLRGEDCINIVSTGLELGYRQIDTAELYKNHKEVAQGIDKSKIPRTDIFITSKIFNQNISKIKISESLDKMLKELNTDYLDLVLLHNPVKNYQLAWEELIRIKSHFNIKYIGTSNFAIKHIDLIKEKTGYTPYLNQIELSIFNQPSHTLIEYHKSNNIIIQAHSIYTNNSLLSNYLLNKYSNKLNIPPHKLMLKYLSDLDIKIVTGTTNIINLKNNYDWIKETKIDVDNDMILKLNCDYKIYNKFV